MDIDASFSEIAALLREEGVGDSLDPFRAVDGRIVLEISPEVQKVLTRVFEDLLAVLVDEDPIGRVLQKNPHEDEMDSAAWDLLANDAISKDRVKRCARVIENLSEGSMDVADVEAWLMSCNDVRLLLCGNDPTPETVAEVGSDEGTIGSIYTLMSAVMHELLRVW